MKAKKFIASGLKFVLLAVVAAFLALHSINLFRFVFPPDQQYLAWMGFGLTGFGAISYLIMFLWEGGTVLQKSVSLGMAVICSIGEVLAAVFGMQIESWTKAGFTLTENDFTTMLLVIGILSIAHFFALITYFAGDKIGELFTDKDGDGIPDIVDPIDNRTGKTFVRGAVLAADTKQDRLLDQANARIEKLIKDITPISQRAQEILDQEAGQGSANGNGHKAEKDFTNPPRR
jgi:hypothetical protein